MVWQHQKQLYELNHADEWEDHKYVARIPTGNIRGNKYMYFYTNEEYKTYVKNMKMERSVKMTAKEAYLLFRKHLGDKDVHHVMEYDSCFVFVCGDPKLIANDAYAVNKQTGDVYYFNPMQMPIEEFKKGVFVPEIK